MGSGLGQSTFFIYTRPYSTVRAALGADAKSADDATAMLNTPSGITNPINGNASLAIKSANGRAIGLVDTPESLFGAGSPCPGFTGRPVLASTSRWRIVSATYSLSWNMRSMKFLAWARP
jgi:hypothetical protein